MMISAEAWRATTIRFYATNALKTIKITLKREYVDRQSGRATRDRVEEIINESVENRSVDSTRST